jgi:hypothetical protein
MITILSRMVLSHDFMTFKVKIGIKELGNDVLKYMKFHIVETNETRHKRAGSLKTYILQDHLVRDKFGARCKTFFKIKRLVLWFCGTIPNLVSK